MVSCDHCGFIELSGAPYQGPPLSESMRGLAQRYGGEVGEELPIELGPLKGAAIRLRNLMGWDGLVIGVDDGCVHLSMTVAIRGSLDGSRFRHPWAIAEAMLIERIPRGRVADPDIRCLKSTLHASFETFQGWAFPPPPPPVEVPSLKSSVEAWRSLDDR